MQHARPVVDNRFWQKQAEVSTWYVFPRWVRPVRDVAWPRRRGRLHGRCSGGCGYVLVFTFGNVEEAVQLGATGEYSTEIPSEINVEQVCFESGDRSIRKAAHVLGPLRV